MIVDLKVKIITKSQSKQSNEKSSVYAKDGYYCG